MIRFAPCWLLLLGVVSCGGGTSTSPHDDGTPEVSASEGGPQLNALDGGTQPSPVAPGGVEGTGGRPSGGTVGEGGDGEEASAGKGGSSATENDGGVSGETKGTAGSGDAGGAGGGGAGTGGMDTSGDAGKASTGGSGGTPPSRECFDGAIDVQSVALSGVITVDGASSASNHGWLSLESGADRTRLGNTADQTFSTRVVPGSYDVTFDDSDSGVRYVLQAGVTIAASGNAVLDVDVPLAVVNMPGPPRGVADQGSVVVSGRLLMNGIDVSGTGPLGLLARGASDRTNGSWVLVSDIDSTGYTAWLNPGTYDFSYLDVDGGTEHFAWFATNGGMPTVLTAAVPDKGGFQVDIDVPVGEVGGVASTNGGAWGNAGSLGLVSRGLLGTAWLTPDEAGTFTGRVIAGTYDLVVQRGSAGPQNLAALLATDVTVSSAGTTTLDVDVPSVAISGAITLEGSVVDSESDFGTLYLATDEGDQVPLGAALAGSYSTEVVPGTYDVIFQVADDLDAGEAPLNRRGKVMRDVVIEAGAPLTLDIDVESTVISGAVTINGAIVDTDVDGGRIWLRDAQGDALPLGWTADGEYEARVIPGTYDVYYEGTLPTSVAPRNTNAKIGCLVVP